MKRISKQVMAGNVKIGGGAPVTVQSMLNVPSTDIEGSVRQAVALEKAGCQILRAAIPRYGCRAADPRYQRENFHSARGGYSFRL